MVYGIIVDTVMIIYAKYKVGDTRNNISYLNRDKFDYLTKHNYTIKFTIFIRFVHLFINKFHLN